MIKSPIETQVTPSIIELTKKRKAHIANLCLQIVSRNNASGEPMYPGATTSERFGFIQRYRELGVTFLCDWLDVSSSGFYTWRKREASQRWIEDQRPLAASRRKCVKGAARIVYGVCGDAHHRLQLNKFNE